MDITRSRMWIFGACLFVAAGLAGCTGDPLAPGSGDAVGTGTGTLVVSGTVYASPRQSNATATTDFDIDFTVRVLLDNQTVTAGNVTVTSATGKVSLTLDGDERGGAVWTGSATGYDEVYLLDVVSGADKAEGVRVDGPDIHTFLQPIEDATVDPGTAVAVLWRRQRQADTASLRVDGNPPTRIADSTSYTLPPGALRPDKLESRSHTLCLARTNSVTPMGAVGPSSFSVTIENDVDVITPPLPL